MAIEKWLRILNQSASLARHLKAPKAKHTPAVPAHAYSAGDPRPHVQLGWTLNEVRSRYRGFKGEASGPICASVNPLLDEEVRALVRLTDQHKTHSIQYRGIPRWDIQSTLFVTFDEADKVMEIVWFLAGFNPLSLHHFNLIEEELKGKFGKAEKSIVGRIVEWLWKGDKFDVFLAGTIGNVVEDAYIVIAFTGHRHDAETQGQSTAHLNLNMIYSM